MLRDRSHSKGKTSPCMYKLGSSTYYNWHYRQKGVTIQGPKEGTLPLNPSEEAANTFSAHPLSYACCPILFLDWLLG